VNAQLDTEDFEIVTKRSRFDPLLLSEVQIRLHEAQESELTPQRATQCVEWLRRMRRELEASNDAFHDGISWLLVAEAVMQASLSRTESRGFFFRPDYQEQNQALDHFYSCAWYDENLDEVKAGLWTWPDIASRFRIQTARAEAEEIVCDDRR